MTLSRSGSVRRRRSNLTKGANHSALLRALTPLPGGGAEATILLNNLIDVRRRVLSCGGRARVLAPLELRRAVANDAVALLAGHNTPTDEANGR